MEDSELELIKKKKMAEMMMKSENKENPNKVIEIGSTDEFNKLVNDNKDNLILVDCWAPWCGPCRAFAPIFKQLQKDFYKKGVIFTKLNTDNHRDIAQQFHITGIPTTLFIHNKKLVHRNVGLQNQNQFRNTINSVLEKINEN